MAGPGDSLMALRRDKPQPSWALNLSSNELLHPLLSPLFEECLADPKSTKSICAYPFYDRTRERVGDLLGRTASSIVLTAGSDFAASLILQRIAPRETPIFLQRPNYEGWLFHARLLGLNVRFLDHLTLNDATRFHDDMQILAAAEPTLVVISNPNGPSGYALNSFEFEALCEAIEGNGHRLVVDECYVGFDSAADVDWSSRLAGAISVRTFSKSFGLAGARIAAIASPPDLIDCLGAGNPEFCVSGLALQLFDFALERQVVFAGIRDDVMRSKPLLDSVVQSVFPEAAPLVSAANFINYRLKGEEDIEVAQRLFGNYRIRIKTTHGMPGLRNCIRLTLAEASILRRYCSFLD